MSAIQVPPRTTGIGFIDFNLNPDPKGDPDVRSVDAYSAHYLYESMMAEMVEEQRTDGRRRTQGELLRKWAAEIFGMTYEDWCPMSAAFVHNKVEELIEGHKKKDTDTNGASTPSSMAQTASPRPARKRSKSSGVKKASGSSASKSD